MKIYNKKVFASGVFMAALGVLNLIADISGKKVDINGIVLIAVLLFLGVGMIMRSLSQKLSKEDRVEEFDERNRLIELKSKSKAFRLTQAISFVLMLTSLIMGKVSGYDGFTAMGAGLAFEVAISLFAELFTYFYYEARN